MVILNLILCARQLSCVYVYLVNYQMLNILCMLYTHRIVSSSRPVSRMMCNMPKDLLERELTLRGSILEG